MIKDIIIIGVLVGIIILLECLLRLRKNYKGDIPYHFRYYLLGGNPDEYPFEYLGDWKVNRLDNYLYLLDLSLAEDLDMGLYLSLIWEGYKGREVIIEVTSHEGIEEKYVIRKGKVCVMQK